MVVVSIYKSVIKDGNLVIAIADIGMEMVPTETTIIMGVSSLT